MNATANNPMYIAHNSYQVETGMDLPTDFQFRSEPPGGPTVHDLCPAGTIVKTSYSTGPYTVFSVSPRMWRGLRSWSLTCSAVGKQKPEFYMNEYVAVDGRILHLFSNNDSEVMILDRPGGSYGAGTPRARDVQDKLDGLTPEAMANIAGMFKPACELQANVIREEFRAGLLASLPKGKRRLAARASALREILARYQNELRDGMLRYNQLRHVGPAALSDYVLTFQYGLDVEQAMLWQLTELESDIRHNLTRIAMVMQEIALDEEGTQR